MTLQDIASDIILGVEQISNLIKEKATLDKLSAAFNDLQEDCELYQMVAEMTLEMALAD